MLAGVRLGLLLLGGRATSVPDREHLTEARRHRADRMAADARHRRAPLVVGLQLPIMVDADARGEAETLGRIVPVDGHQETPCCFSWLLRSCSMTRPTCGRAAPGNLFGS